MEVYAVEVREDALQLLHFDLMGGSMISANGANGAGNVRSYALVEEVDI
jgi:hypothetical protein